MAETQATARLARERQDLPVLARRIVHEVAMAITPHTPGEDHAEPASRVASIAALEVLVADVRSRMTPQKRAYLAALIEEIRRGANDAQEAGRG